MDRKELVKIVAKRTGHNQPVVKEIINTMIDVIQEKLLFGLNVKLKGFITFTREISPERKGTHPQTQEEIIIPKKHRVKTVLAKSFVDKIKSKPVY
jgi:nucleoid DNA-binding protein